MRRQRHVLCYITDRSQFRGDEARRQQSLLRKVGEAARAGVDFVQLREKDLSTRDLERLAREAMSVIRAAESAAPNAPRTRLLINSRSDVAIAVCADGVHLRSDDISVTDARGISTLVRTRSPKLETEKWIVTVSCHSEADVCRVASEGANFALFAPVFEKKDTVCSHPAGLEALHKACQHEIPVLALGGVTLANAHLCLEAGAAGIAAIRLFQENDIAVVARSLRAESC